MANTIKHKRGTTAPQAGQLVVGELAINTTTGEVYTKTDGGSVVSLVNSASPTFTGDMTATGSLVSTASSGNEGGEIRLATAATGTTLSAGSVTIDVYQNKLRIFETNGTNRGAYIDLTAATASVGSNLLSGGGGGGTWGSITGTLSSQTDLNTALGLKAPLASPTFTGTPAAPTAALADSTTTLATTAFVQQELASGVAVAKSVVATIRNETGSTLTAGQAVYISGSASNKALVTLARADVEATSSGTYGLVQADIATNNNGTAVIAGIITGINTVAYADGDKLYLSPTTAGAFTTTKPSAPNHMVYIGVVTRAHQTQGTIQLRIANGFELDEIHDVAIASKADKDLLTYESSTGLWKNKTISTLGLATLASPTFTGTPLAPTASAGTNTTQVATTAFVTSALTSKANLASPALTGTPTAPTAATATNTTQIATTAYVKTNLSSYAPLNSPGFTSNPTAPTPATTSDATLLATTAFVKANLRKTPTYFNGDLTGTSALSENNVYFSNTNAPHSIVLAYAGYYNVDGVVIMFKQHDNSQMNFNDGNGWTFAPNGNCFYAAFPNAVVFAVRISAYSWFIFGDLTSTQYQAYGTVITSAAVDTSNTVPSGQYDYYGNQINAYTYYSIQANGWGGSFSHYENAPYGTVMSDNFTYSSSSDTYNLTADGYGSFFYNFVSGGGGGGYDPYGTKIGTPYWDSGYQQLWQTIADGSGGSTSVVWDGYSPYPTNGTQVSTTSYNQSGYKTDAIGGSYWVNYDQTYYADGMGGWIEGWSMSSGNYYPSGWALDGYHVDSSKSNTMTYWYDSTSNYIYAYDYGYNGADGMGNTQWFSISGGMSWYPPYGTQMTVEHYNQSYQYGYYQADGNGGYSFNYL